MLEIKRLRQVHWGWTRQHCHQLCYLETARASRSRCSMVVGLMAPAAGSAPSRSRLDGGGELEGADPGIVRPAGSCTALPVVGKVRRCGPFWTVTSVTIRLPLSGLTRRNEIRGNTSPFTVLRFAHASLTSNCAAGNSQVASRDLDTALESSVLIRSPAAVY